MMRIFFAESGSNVKQKVHYINLFKASWTHNPIATESRASVGLVGLNRAAFLSHTAQLLTAKLVPLITKQL